MTQEIEIEFKNIVTKTDFKKLLEAFSIDETKFTYQINHYFDTNNFQIKAHSSALRIREKSGKYILTLKQPNKVGLLETHQQLNSDTAINVLKGGLLPNGEIANQLKNCFDIDIAGCKLLGTLQTKRAEIPYLNGTLVFDHSYYLGVEDFEIEYEVIDEKQGYDHFRELFAKYEIPIKKTQNKIQRFFTRKIQLK